MSNPEWRTAEDGIAEFIQDGNVLGYVSYERFNGAWCYVISGDAQFLRACTGVEDGKRKVEEGTR